MNTHTTALSAGMRVSHHRKLASISTPRTRGAMTSADAQPAAEPEVTPKMSKTRAAGGERSV
jgi:hypothetical protein